MFQLLLSPSCPSDFTPQVKEQGEGYVSYKVYLSQLHSRGICLDKVSCVHTLNHCNRLGPEANFTPFRCLSNLKTIRILWGLVSVLVLCFT